jgi:23S rRNA pseudouridine1911/1915/1917 synthase
MKFKVETDQQGQRIDQFLANQISDLSRSQIQELIEHASVNGNKTKKNYKVSEGDEVEFVIPEAGPSTLKPIKQKLDVVYEDDHILCINKDPFIPVHPDKKMSHEITLVNLLLGNKVPLSKLGGNDRPGIVHRLDMDTSGLILIAKTDQAYKHLQEQFQARKVKKIYQALSIGEVTPPKGRIEAPIGRDNKDRKKMSVNINNSSKDAVSEYKVLKVYKTKKFETPLSLLEVQIPTGRTHQIRVHLQAIGFPIIGDSTYGNHKLNKTAEQLDLKRQFLHAYQLEFTNLDNKKIKLTGELKPDLKDFIEKIKN